jgi:two-component system CheB/CheR fusion protein
MLSHELRNPLGAVLNGTYLLEKPDLDRQTAGRAAQTVQRQARQMARLLDDLLDVSRVTHGKIEMRETVLDLNTLVPEVVQAVRSLIDQKRHQFQVVADDEPLVVCGDPARLLQIQQNLLANAAKYTPPGGRIELILTRENDQAVIRVRDNGVGVPPDMLESIFELFVQTQSSLDRSDSGMGVGLTLVHTLVKMHRGSVVARSGGHGQGAEFEVRLPLSDEPLTDASLPGTPAKESPNLSVLIVEDNEDSRNMLRDLLQLDGHEVLVAEDGSSGLRAIETQRPDVALIDIGLPGISGYEVAKHVRQKLRDDEVRLVGLTNILSNRSTWRS